MKGKRIHFVLLFIFIILISSTSVVSAYSSTAWLNLTYQNQAKSLWCWADCGSVIVNHNQPPTCSQFGFCYNTFGNYNNQGALLGDVQRGLNYYSVTSTYNDSYITFNTIQNQITLLQPVMVHQYIFLVGSHAVLIDGYDTTFGNYVFYMNPHYNLPSTVEYVPYADFVDSDDYFWWHTLYNIHD